ncbi:hypothetical protein BT96DRAFT_1027564, partial [Gymnopus androsaceus JB14]
WTHSLSWALLTPRVTPSPLIHLPKAVLALPTDSDAALQADPLGSVNTRIYLHEQTVLESSWLIHRRRLDGRPQCCQILLSLFTDYSPAILSLPLVRLVAHSFPHIQVLPFTPFVL